MYFSSKAVTSNCHGKKYFELVISSEKKFISIFSSHFPDLNSNNHRQNMIICTLQFNGKSFVNLC